MTPAITIVTAVYGAESTIGDTLESLARQDFSDWEHWVIDGASPDRTLEVVRGLPDARRQILSEPDGGVYEAMNKGIARARGEVLGFLNADDFYESDTVLSQIAAAFQDPEVEIVYGNLRYVASDDPSRVVRDWVSGPYRPGAFGRAWTPPHPTVYARRALFERWGGFDESMRIAGDWDWLFRMFEIHGVKARYLDEHLVRMRLGGVSNRSLGGLVQNQCEIARAFRKHGLRMPWRFLPAKLLHRGRQFQKRLSA